ncbi:hypothetical protein, partial [Nostoc sp. 2RC]|uniref:hypothetical protein n=1 Tax=Nostoc sp. 2RC TaxID=2485484 RepID=UPI0016282512
MKKIVEELRSNILNKNSKQALPLLMQGLSQNEVELLKEIKKQGIFRCSTYDFEFNTLQVLIDHTTSKKLFSKESTSYFQSVKSLLFIGRELNKTFKKIIQEIDKSTLKSYLVCLDSLFWPNHINNNIFNNKNNNFQTFGYSKEEIASAFSFLFFKLNDNKNLDINQLNSVDIKGIRDNIFIKNLSSFYKIIDFKEIEILLDCFGYKAIRKVNQVIIEPPDERLGKSIDLGYIKYELQHSADSIDLIANFNIIDNNSLIQCARKFALELKDILFSIEEKPSKRIVMRFPMIKELISGEQLFFEELILIKSIQKELF